MYFISYKQMLMKNEILARYTIIKERLILKRKIKEISSDHFVHRNTIRNLINSFNKKAPDWALELFTKSLSLEEINSYFSFLSSISRAPHSNKRSASIIATKFLISEFNRNKKWASKMYTYLKRRWLLKKYNLTFSKIKWIYKKNNLKIKKVRVASWRCRPLYDYEAIMPFEYIHIDTKHILDKKWLTQDIYDKFNLNAELPIYQWTIIDAKSRFRFLLYSHKINSTMGINILLYIIMFIRYCWIDYHITIWTDWWSEFFSASDKKKVKRNNLLKQLNSEIYCYHWSRDIRKNLIERSHKTDDEEFYNPRWLFINNENTFIKEAYHRFLYYNFQRPIWWKYMKWKIPIEILSQSKILNIKRLLNFPVLIIDNCLWDIMYHTATVRLSLELSKKPDFSTEKNKIDFMFKYNFLNNIFAQNVLDYYQITIN